MIRVFATGLGLASLCSCGSGGLEFYEVLRSRVTECLIRVNGEFCVEPDQFDPPSLEVWTLEERDGRSILYVSEEVWILDVLPEDADPATTPRATTKASVVIDGQTGCRTDAERSVSFIADRNGFEGTLTSRSVTTGPAACGSTPVGLRTVDDVIGGVSGP
jgi:hypothetical protein